MPYPLYHIGPNAFTGLTLKKWIDPAVIILVNVVVDLEVLTATEYPDYHRHWHFHTFLAGAILGAIFGLLCWFAKPLLKRVMNLLRIKYKPRLWSMMLAGTLGIWIHVLLDSIYHWDVQPFWPYKKNVIWHFFKIPKTEYDVDQILKTLCFILLCLAFILYIFAVRSFNKEYLKGSVKSSMKK